MTPEDEYEARKMRRQMGEHGPIVMALIAVVSITVVSWIGKRFEEWKQNQQPPGDPQAIQAEPK